jgi:hypothetical protein
MSIGCVAVLFLVLAGCAGSDRTATSSTTTSTAAPAAAAPAGRQLTDTERAAMLQALAAEEGPVRKVWFAVPAGDAEAAALADAFAAVFKQAGWEPVTQRMTGIMLKPGLSILMAEEQPPSYATVAQQALESTGFEFKSGTGYRPYFEERHRADPNWPGIPLAPDQDFVVVVGPKPPPS